MQKIFWGFLFMLFVEFFVSPLGERTFNSVVPEDGNMGIGDLFSHFYQPGMGAMLLAGAFLGVWLRENKPSILGMGSPTASDRLEQAIQEIDEMLVDWPFISNDLPPTVEWQRANGYKLLSIMDLIQDRGVPPIYLDNQIFQSHERMRNLHAYLSIFSSYGKMGMVKKSPPKLSNYANEDKRLRTETEG